MKATWIFRTAVLTGALLIGFWSGDVQAAKGSFEETYSVDEPFLLDVSTGSGSVDIRAGDAGEITVTGQITVRKGWFGGGTENAEELVEKFEASPPVEISDGLVRVGHIKDRAFRRNVSISYEIVVPADTRVKSHTGSGAQDVSGVAGPVEVGTGSGRLTLNDIGGLVKARTGSGAIRADGTYLQIQDRYFSYDIYGSGDETQTP